VQILRSSLPVMRRQQMIQPSHCQHPDACIVIGLAIWPRFVTPSLRNGKRLVPASGAAIEKKSSGFGTSPQGSRVQWRHPAYGFVHVHLFLQNGCQALCVAKLDRHRQDRVPCNHLSVRGVLEELGEPRRHLRV